MHAPFAACCIALMSLANCVRLGLGEVSGEWPLKLLRERLLKNYTTRLRPVLHHENTTVVTFELLPTHIGFIDEQHGILVVDTVAAMSWEDQNLRWNPGDYSGIERIHLAPTQVWKPDVRVFTSRSYRTAPWSYADVTVDSRGRVTWEPAATMVLICAAFDYRQYPGDVQTCWMTIGSWLEDRNEIDYVLARERTYNFETTNPHWKMEAFNEMVIPYQDMANESQVVMWYSMNLRRVDVSHSYLGSVPDTVARLLILCVFWLPGLTEKLCLGCFTLVLLTTIIVHVNHLLPSSAAAPFALAEPTAALEMCMAAVILAMAVSFLAVLDVACPVILDRLSRVRVLQIFASGTTKKTALIEEDQDGMSESSKSGSRSNHWVFLGILIDKVAFIIFAVMLLIF